jgi:hypothetical protein
MHAYFYEKNYPLCRAPATMRVKSAFFWGQVESLGFVLEIPFMRPIAKGFIGRASAATKRNQGPTLKAIKGPVLIENLEIALDFKRTVTVYCDFSGSHKEINGFVLSAYQICCYYRAAQLFGVNFVRLALKEK